MVKTKITLDIMHGKERMMTGMYLSTEKVIRPRAPSDVSVWNDIMSCFSVSRCGETLSQRDIHLLVQGVLACARARSWIPVE